MTRLDKQPNVPTAGGHDGHGGHGLLMIACCIPMLILAVVLVAIGAVSPSFLLYAVGCTAMMALMMRGMRNDKGADPHAQDQRPDAAHVEGKGHGHTLPR